MQIIKVNVSIFLTEPQHKDDNAILTTDTIKKLHLIKYELKIHVYSLIVVSLQK